MPEDLRLERELLSKAELSVWLDSYDDVFSDFDSRPVLERALSDDFLNEAKKMVKEKPDGKIELKLLIPSSLRNPEIETAVIKNLHAHFRHFTHADSLEKKKLRLRGVLLTISGFVLLILATFISNLPERTFFHNTILILVEPSGWFVVWTGLDHLFSIARKRNQEYEFNRRMAYAEIVFLSF